MQNLTALPGLFSLPFLCRPAVTGRDDADRQGRLSLETHIPGLAIYPSASPPPVLLPLPQSRHPSINLICSPYVRFPSAGAELWNLWVDPSSPVSSKPRAPAAGREKATETRARIRGCLSRPSRAKPPPQPVKGQARFSLRKETWKLLFPTRRIPKESCHGNCCDQHTEAINNSSKSSSLSAPAPAGILSLDPKVPAPCP